MSALEFYARIAGRTILGIIIGVVIGLILVSM